jgi:hypothetical protein
MEQSPISPMGEAPRASQRIDILRLRVNLRQQLEAILVPSDLDRSLSRG